jgi:MFS family permease
MITAYTLAFGGLLLLGGRVGDRFGRKRTFLVGLAGFALASALGGAAQPVDARVHGYRTATVWGTAILISAGVVAAVLIHAGRSGTRRSGRPADRLPARPTGSR